MKSRPPIDKNDVLAEFLKQASPFGSLKPERLLPLVQQIVSLSLKSGDYVVREGDAGGSCFVVRSGQVEVLQTENQQQKQVAVLGPGSLFGEAALLTDSPRNASVRAIDPTELLEIRRKDFLRAIDENRQLGRQVFELLNLRDRPIRKSDIQEQLTTAEDGTEITILSDPGHGTYFRLSTHGRLIWQNLDGHHNLKDITLLYLEKFQTFSPHTIAETVFALIASGFAKSRSTRAAFLLIPSWGQRILGEIRHLFEWRLMLQNVDPLVSRIHRSLHPLFSKGGQLLIGTISLLGLFFFLKDLPMKWSQTPLSTIHKIGPLLLVLLILSGFFHETGHALATKAFGRKILGVGIGWNWISPILFVDTSDMWLAPRWQRVVVSLAGPYTHLVLGGISSCISLMLTESETQKILWLFTTGSYLLFLMNLLPILNLDGHYVWQELRQKKRN